MFKTILLSVKSENSLFSIYNLLRVKLSTLFRLHFSHLNEHKFKHGFCDIVNPMCACRAELETYDSSLLHCCSYSTQKPELYYSITLINLTHLFHNRMQKIKSLICCIFLQITQMFYINM